MPPSKKPPRYYEIHDWEDHQPPEARNGGATFIRNYTRLLALPKYKLLNAGERGVLHGLWLYRGLTGARPPLDPSQASLALGLVHTRHMLGQLKRLELLGFITPRVHQRRRDKKREEKTPPTPRSRGATNSPPGFARFWESYPRKVGKQAALKSWKRQKLESRAEAILHAVEQQKNSEPWLKENGEFIPHPTTWLNQGRWEDQTREPPQGPRVLTKDEKDRLYGRGAYEPKRAH